MMADVKHTNPAIENLRTHQRQLDADGCEVGVSRQALDEVLAITAELLGAAVYMMADLKNSYEPSAAACEKLDAAIAMAEGR